MSEVPTLLTARLRLTMPEPGAAPRMVDYLRRNAAHFAPWSPPDPPDWHDVDAWEARFELARQEHEADRSLRLVLLPRDEPDGPVLGTCNFTHFIRGAFQACNLGYAIDRAHEGRGLMREAVTAGIAHAFDVLRLHRIQANHVPENARSARLLASLGFTVEGLARDYLFIGGAWRDHVLTSRSNPRLSVPEFMDGRRP